MKWVSKGRKKKYSMKRFFKGFIYAVNGIIKAFKTEQNLLIETIFEVIIIILSIYLKVSNIELCLIIISTSLVIVIELINTGIEYTIDMMMPEVHPLAKIAKDVSEGSVLFSFITSLIVILIILLPKLF